MALTNLQIGSWNVLGMGILPSTQGKTIHCKPYSGSDSNGGATPDEAVKTLSKALSIATANQNDIVYLYAESNTAASTTDYQSATLDWNKDGVHLIGVGAAPVIGQRARIAFASTYNSAYNLFTLSANNCLLYGLEIFEGVAGTSPTGCMKVTGYRNVIRRCQISGMGGAAGANDIASAYSLTISAGQENVFEDCYIGLDTVTLGAQINAQVYLSSAAARNIFKGCLFTTYTNHATNNQFLRIGASGIDRFVEFRDCFFLNPAGAALAGSTALTQAFTINAAPGGAVLLTGTTSGFGFTDWNSADTGNVIVANAAPTAGTSGLALAATR